ncbi:Flagellar basal-body rod protein FlgB [Sulfitobacter noctilucae]|uniref:FlgB family protein n=1 Tax=Sulfitobacter noctilucae TaxID=1342302 RepID=UPI0004696406|nr:FlgB family protein [Sulfitobacter noctilucae]KIN65919.1 Flagellar basal-body rod protein FlgB [Sulfitobacter noctilucae]
MFENIDIFRMSAAMARHAGQKQAVVAQNVANADTPNYKARDIADFANTYVPADNAGAQRATRAQHLHGALNGSMPTAAVVERDQASPNGNQVSLETETLKSVDAKRQHDRALAIYKTALSVLRTSIRMT